MVPGGRTNWLCTQLHVQRAVACNGRRLWSCLLDAAYESLLLSRRRDWHERIARAIEAYFPDLTANEPELLAHHYGEAGLAGPACDYRMRAGDRAVNRSAYKEAIAHFSAGLKAAETLPDSVERMRRQLDLQLKLGAALTIVRGAQRAEVENAYRLASDLGDRLGDSSHRIKPNGASGSVPVSGATTRMRHGELS